MSLNTLPVGGNLANCIKCWEKLTSDPWILNIVRGFKLPLWTIPFQEREPRPFNLSKVQLAEFSAVIESLLKKKVIEETEECEGQFISNVFLRPKPNGKHRLILDLTLFNKFLILQHFKMESLDSALDLINKDDFMATIDLQDAYFTILVHKSDRKFLRFRWKGCLYQFRGVPMGLACAPYIFTKLLIPVFAEFRERGFQGFCYLDDAFVLGSSERECHEAVIFIGNALSELGFKINVNKSQFDPSRLIKFLGFMIDSSRLRVYLPADKVLKMTQSCEKISNSEVCSIQEVASLVGLMTSYCKALDYSENHIKCLEKEKIWALALNNDNFEGSMSVTKRGREDIKWWRENCETGFRRIRVLTTELTLITDASNEGWGAVCGAKSGQGRWLVSEQDLHINVKELLAVLFGLKSLCNVSGSIIRVLSDNITTVIYINKFGGVKSMPCNRVAHLIWSWCETKGNWLIAAHIPGTENVRADGLSRNFSNNVEWQLSEGIFQKVCERFGTPTVDLFASRENTKIKKFCSWGADPEAWRIDAFSFAWVNEFYYIFPPFRLIGRVWKKIQEEKSHAVLIVPNWPSQTWFTAVQKSARRILFFQRREGNLKHQKNPLITGNLTTSPLIACLY